MRVRAHESGALLECCFFDENDSSDWQHSVHETRTSELGDDMHDQHDNTDHMQQPDTDIPGAWKWQVGPKSDLYGDRTGKLMDLEKVVRGRLSSNTWMIITSTIGLTNQAFQRDQCPKYIIYRKTLTPGGSGPVAQAQEKCSSVSSTGAATDSLGGGSKGDRENDQHVVEKEY